MEKGRLGMMTLCWLLGNAVAEPLKPAPIGKPPAEGGFTQFFEKVDPKQDASAWGAEAFADTASTVLKHLAQAMEERTLDKLPEADAAYASGPLRPAALRKVTDDGVLAVLRGEPDATAFTEKGPAALAKALQTWLAAYPTDTKCTTKFKIVEVTVDEATATARTRAFVQSAGSTTQQSATWDCVWKYSKTPTLLGIQVSEYEEVTHVASRQSPLFLDAAPTVLGETESWKNFLTYGLDHWFQQVDAAFQIPQGYHGVCVRDVNGDGREDVFLCQPAGIRNMLFLRQTDGSLKDATAAAGLDFLDNTRSALFVDFDNDGDADAAVTLGYQMLIFENDGTGKFTKKTGVDMASWIMSMAAADYDNDGRLDIYLCGYGSKESVKGGDLLGNPVPYHDANNGAPNFLLHNEGGFKFTNTTEQTGMGVNNRKFSNAAAWEDYDNDGDMDLYVANDFGRKNLYRNELIKNGKRQPTAHFVDVATEAGVPDLGAGMSAAWADYNHDGHMDLYVANMFSSAGRRIASQKDFKANDTPENRAGLLRLARGNSLFKNNGNGTFEDLGEPSGTFLGRWAWASLFADLNNDSWEDIYVCNGFYTRPDPADL